MCTCWNTLWFFIANSIIIMTFKQWEKRNQAKWRCQQCHQPKRKCIHKQITHCKQFIRLTEQFTMSKCFKSTQTTPTILKCWAKYHKLFGQLSLNGWSFEFNALFSRRNSHKVDLASAKFLHQFGKLYQPHEVQADWEYDGSSKTKFKVRWHVFEHFSKMHIKWKVWRRKSMAHI